MSENDKIFNALLSINSELGETKGCVNSIKTDVTDIKNKLSHTVTKEECDKNLSNQKKETGKLWGSLTRVKEKVASLPAFEEDEISGVYDRSIEEKDGWKKANTRIAVIIGIIVLLGFITAGFVWAVNRYNDYVALQTLVDKKKENEEKAKVQKEILNMLKQFKKQNGNHKAN